MKEAAGEANLTVIAIILIAVIAAVVTPIINSYLRTAAQKGCCTNYGGVWSKNQCHEVDASGAITTVIGASDYFELDSRTCKDAAK